MARVYGIDMGSDSIRIYQKEKGIIYNEKNAIALFDKKNVIAIGNEAWKMEGKTPPNISVEYPFRLGVPADLKNMVTMLNMIFDSLGEEHGKLFGQDFLVAVPVGITEVQKKAYVELLSETLVKPKSIKVVDKPIADALGADVDIKEVSGTLIVDMGAETVALSVMSYGGIAMSKTLSFGGKRLDDCIVQAVRKYYNFVVGPRTAEQIKIKLCDAIQPKEDDVVTLQVFGRKVLSGLPGSIPLDSSFAHLAIKDTLELIVDSIKSVLEHVPPEIFADVTINGIHLTGGLSQIKNFAKMIQDSTGIPVSASANGSESGAKGLGKIMEDKELEIFADTYTALQLID